MSEQKSLTPPTVCVNIKWGWVNKAAAAAGRGFREERTKGQKHHRLQKSLSALEAPTYENFVSIEAQL